MVSKLVEVKLGISASGNSVIATLCFSNISDQDIYLEKVNACLFFKDENDVFYISSGGKQISYIGRLSKSSPPGPYDVVKLLKGDKISTSIDLCKAYEMYRSGDEYSVTYSAYHSSPNDITPITLIKTVSDEAIFRF
jgi:hypothetical protein